MSKDPVFNEPMREVILSMSAWRRLKTKAAELEAEGRIIGPIMLYYMNEAWTDAEKNMKDSEKSLMKQMKEAAE